MANYTLITGASGGIGFALARQFAAGGHPLILVARSEGRLSERKAELEKEYGVAVEILPQDLTQPHAARQVYDAVATQGWTVDILVNNAGFGDFVSFVDADWQHQEDMVTLNVTALMQLTHCFARAMREQGGGRILNVASLAAVAPGPYMATYYATKAFVLSFSEAMSEELREYGITVTALCPGPTESNFEAAANLKSGNLFSALPVERAETVARRGYKATMKGRAVRYCGITVCVMSFLSRLTPRWLNRKATKRINGKPTKGENV
ncbi:MAG: SDR family oxidoreductase [Ruminococcaceae bacterium]|nr:SDR family oxidoreductase [Oscillospiraceae bacterium]